MSIELLTNVRESRNNSSNSAATWSKFRFEIPCIRNTWGIFPGGPEVAIRDISSHQTKDLLPNPFYFLSPLDLQKKSLGILEPFCY